MVLFPFFNSQSFNSADLASFLMPSVTSSVTGFTSASEEPIAKALSASTMAGSTSPTGFRPIKRRQIYF
jgi:hypothetical protein